VDQISGSTTPADAPAPASAPADAATPAPDHSPAGAATPAPDQSPPAGATAPAPDHSPAGATAPAPDHRPPAGAATPAPDQSPPAGAVASPESAGFRSRGSARRRARFLRRARELAYRDLGGLVFNLHRFGARNDALVLAKLTTLGHIDAELRALEDALEERRPITVLREAGITACPRCAAIHGSDDRFCPHCGLAIGRHVDLPADLRSGVGAPLPANAAAPSPQPPAGPAPGPVAPSPAPARVASASGGEDQPTEILHPQGGGA
jgi:hypothetical protein